MLKIEGFFYVIDTTHQIFFLYLQSYYTTILFMGRKMRYGSCQSLAANVLNRCKDLALVVLTVIVCQNVQAQQMVVPFSDPQDPSMALAVDSVGLVRIPADTGPAALCLRMQFCLVGAEMPKGRTVILTPRLSDNTHSAEFPAVEVFGSWAYFSLSRGYTPNYNVHSSATAMELRSKDVHGFTAYNQQVAWEPWMSEATLRLDLSYLDERGTTTREESRAAFPTAISNHLTETASSANPIQTEPQLFQTYKSLFALKTNLLYDLVAAPNIEVEVPLGRRARWTVMGEFWSPWFRWKKLDYAYQIQGGGVELRHWFAPKGEAGRPFLTGHFLGLYGAGARYDLEYDTTGDQGDVFSGGLTYGYSMPIGRHWNLEMSVSGGVIAGQRRHYSAEFESTHLIYKYTKNLFYAGPTKLKVSLVWIIGKKGGRS